MEPQVNKNSVEKSQKLILSKAVLESSMIVQEIIENDGQLGKKLDSMMDLKNICLPGKMDHYGYMWDRLEGEEKYWNKHRHLIVAISIRKVKNSLKNRIKFAMKAIKLKEISGEEFRFVLIERTSGIVALEKYPKLKGEKNEKSK